MCVCFVAGAEVALCGAGWQAEKVMGTLRALADSGHTVVCTIHQPRGSIFRMFDDLMLMSAGRVVYSGPAGDAVNAFVVRAADPLATGTCPVTRPQ